MAFQPAKRGDLAIIEVEHPDVGFRAEITEVTSITRDGHVKSVRDRWGLTRTMDRELGVLRTHIASQTKVDVAAVMTAAKAHTWPGHSNQPRPYESLDEVRALLAAHRLKGSAPARAGGTH